MSTSQPLAATLLDDLAGALRRTTEARSRIEAALVIDRPEPKFKLIQAAEVELLGVVGILGVELAWLSGEILKGASVCPGCAFCPHGGEQ